MPINLNQLVLYLSGIDADGTPPTANPILMAGQDGTNVQSLKTNATGQLEVDIVSGGGTGGLTDAELRATPVPVVTQEPISVDDNGGSLTVDGTVAVTGTQTDALTDTELRASPVPVSGTVAATLSEPISVDDNGGSLTVDGTVAVTDGGGSITVDGPLTDAQLRAAAVPVSLSSDIEIGAVELKNGSDDTRATVTAANALKVDGSAVTQPVSAVSLPLPTGAATSANQQTDALTDAELRATEVPVVDNDVATNTAASAASLAILDNIVAGSEAQVDVVAPLPAGTNNIGDVDVLSVNGQSADGAAVAGNPVRIAGKDGGTGLTQDLVTDSAGALYVIAQMAGGVAGAVMGTAADGAAVAGNPVRIGGKDGSGNTQDLITDTNGRLQATNLPVSGRMIDSDDSTTVITVKTTAGTATASGDNTIVSAVGGKKIRVLSYGLQCQEAGTVVTCIWQDSSSTTQRGMKWMLFASADGTSQQGVVRNPGDGTHFYFETAAGAGLDLNLSSATDVGYELTYVEVD